MTAWHSIQILTSEYTGLSIEKLTREHKIEEDLGITGDDADEFLHLFINRFSVDTTGFDISKYFNDEGFDPLGLSFLIRKVFRKPLPNKSEHKLTLGDLEVWAIRGSWV